MHWPSFSKKDDPHDNLEQPQLYPSYTSHLIYLRRFLERRISYFTIAWYVDYKYAYVYNTIERYCFYTFSYITTHDRT